MPSVNQALRPGFVITIEKGANPVMAFSIQDRAGNPIDLTGYRVKLAATRVLNRSNGLGQILPTNVNLFDVIGTITDAVNGNVTFAGLFTGTSGTWKCSLRIWDSTTTTRVPDDAYSGSYTVTVPAAEDF